MRLHLSAGLCLSTVALMGCPAGGPTKGLQSNNLAPTVEVISPEYGSPYSFGSAVVFEAVVGDDATPVATLGIRWESSIDGAIEFGDIPNADGEVSLTLTDLSVGGHSIFITVMDEGGLESEASTLVNIVEEGEPPTIVLVYPSPGDEGISGEDMAFEAVVDDPDDPLTALEVVFTADRGEGEGEICSATADEDGVSSCTSTLAEGVWTVSAMVADALGQTDWATTEDFVVLSPDAHDGDLDGFTEDEGDCDDEDITVYPGAPELPDGQDNNCDGVVDEGTGDVDDDGDGFTEDSGDCDDSDSTVYPGAVERPDGVDEDCDGEIDDETIAYDDDGDCYCEGGAGVEECTGTSADYCPDDGVLTGDCNDDDEDTHPGAAEIADGEDNDCDTLVDEDLDGTDDDGDGFSEVDGDCDDRDWDIHPGALETPDGVDEDCDGIVDDGTTAYDDDGDGFTEDEGDCDDGDDDIHPDAAEDCDAVDDDCDGLTAEDDPDTDIDSDGYSACDEDCDDDDASVHPGATETCNGTDDDCDGDIDEGAVGADIWYRDWDADGYGDSSSTVSSCDPVSGYVSDWTDCDDRDSSVHPGATETCDASDEDEDCDGDADDDDSYASGKRLWYDDGDGDGYGDSSDTTWACDAPSGHTDVSGDCDDFRSDVNPGETERCDGRDNDCDGSTDEAWSTGCSTYYLDSDGDGYGTSSSTCTCEAGDLSGYSASNDDDCCGSDGDAYPGAADYHEDANSCGSFDYNCDGVSTRRYTTYAACSLHVSGDACYEDPAGWSTSISIPTCGSSGNWVFDCRLSIGWGGFCSEATELASQQCR